MWTCIYRLLVPCAREILRLIGHRDFHFLPFNAKCAVPLQEKWPKPAKKDYSPPDFGIQHSACHWSDQAEFKISLKSFPAAWPQR